MLFSNKAIIVYRLNSLECQFRIFMKKEKELVYSLSDIQPDPLLFMQKLFDSYGRIIKYEISGINCIMLNEPKYIEKILHDKEEIYLKTGTPEMQMLKPILGEGLLTSEGALWKLQRDAARPSFTSRQILTYADRILAATRKMLSTWEPFENAMNPIDIEAEMSQLTLNVVGIALFGTSLDSVAEAFGKAVLVINKYMGHFDPSDAEGLQEFGQAMRFLKSTVRDIVDKRKMEPDHSTDFLSDLMNYYASRPKEDTQEDNLVDEIFTFLMAGHETTAKSLTWTLYLLSQNPKKRKLIEDEIDRIGNGMPINAEKAPQLTYTWMCIQEAIRLYPPVWVISRCAAEDDQIYDLTINKGDLIIAVPYLMHRDTEYWPDPEIYEPERFAGNIRKEKPYFAYFPFGGGPRHCIGRHFASLEMILVLCTILQKYQLNLANGQRVEPEAVVTLRPKFGMDMLISTRKTSLNE